MLEIVEEICVASSSSPLSCPKDTKYIETPRNESRDAKKARGGVRAVLPARYTNRLKIIKHTRT